MVNNAHKDIYHVSRHTTTVALPALHTSGIPTKAPGKSIFPGVMLYVTAASLTLLCAFLPTPPQFIKMMMAK